MILLGSCVFHNTCLFVNWNILTWNLYYASKISLTWSIPKKKSNNNKSKTIEPKVATKFCQIFSQYAHHWLKLLLVGQHCRTEVAVTWLLPVSILPHNCFLILRILNNTAHVSARWSSAITSPLIVFLERKKMSKNELFKVTAQSRWLLPKCCETGSKSTWCLFLEVDFARTFETVVKGSKAARPDNRSHQ